MFYFKALVQEVSEHQDMCIPCWLELRLMSSKEKRANFIFFPCIWSVCVCTHMHKCECVRLSASESQRLETEAWFRTWKFEDDPIEQYSDPFLTFALQTLQETLFVYLCSLSNSVYVPASKAFRFLQVHFLIISRPVFPYQRIFPGTCCVRRQFSRTSCYWALLHCTSHVLRSFQIEDKSIHQHDYSSLCSGPRFVGWSGTQAAIPPGSACVTSRLRALPPHSDRGLQWCDFGHVS